MKKILLAITVIALTSCGNKEFTCNCTRTLSDGTDWGGSTYQVEAGDKNEAAEQCGQNGQEVVVDAANITHVCKIQ
jgi:hypothetical protein